MRTLSTLLLVMVGLSCASKQIRKESSPLLTMEVGGVHLKPHQIKPIYYLLNHPEQKGLLINHYLGTGKTFLSLAFGELENDASVIILAPEFLRSSWMSHMDRMTLKNPGRYKFYSYEEADDTLSEEKLEGSLLIVDEIHRLTALIKSQTTSTRTRYANLYQRLSSAKRILALSGTPIFTDMSDIAYVLNLVSGQSLLPFNEREFLDRYTKIEKSRSFWRGHVTESHLLIFGLPFVAAAIPLAFVSPSVGLISGLYFGGLGLGYLSLPLINAAVPLNRYPLRSFDAEKLKPIVLKYVSFFDFRDSAEQKESYPSKKIHTKNVAYNAQQIEFFLEFADKSLAPHQIERLAREKNYGVKGNFAVESTALQTELRAIPLSGREIGNFHFAKGDGALIESPKFESVYQLIGPHPEGVVVYSSYYENGSKLFAEFLTRKGLKDKFAILLPDTSVQEQIDTIKRYNSGQTKILLLHPTFTEGISLQATRMLHILEPLGSEALYEQVIGRTIRLHSHERLAKNLRHVDVYEWCSTLSGLKAFLAKNNNWAFRFRELNSIAAFGKGQAEIDPNHFVKRQSFDEQTRERRFALSNAMTTLKNLLVEYSIEKVFLK